MTHYYIRLCTTTLFDNYAARKHPKVRARLARCSR
jgi:hypothetical protein